MKCLRCDKKVKETFAASWDAVQWCPECYAKSKFEPTDVIKVEFEEGVTKGTIFRLKSTPVDFFLDIYTQKEMQKLESI